MKVGVCLKQVPATDTRIKINGDATGIVTDEVKWETNPYDEFALEAAIQLKEAGKAKPLFAHAEMEAIRVEILAGSDRPHMFIEELKIYVGYLRRETERYRLELSARQPTTLGSPRLQWRDHMLSV